MIGHVRKAISFLIHTGPSRTHEVHQWNAETRIANETCTRGIGAPGQNPQAAFYGNGGRRGSAPWLLSPTEITTWAVCMGEAPSPRGYGRTQHRRLVTCRPLLAKGPAGRPRTVVPMVRGWQNGPCARKSHRLLIPGHVSQASLGHGAREAKAPVALSSRATPSHSAGTQATFPGRMRPPWLPIRSRRSGTPFALPCHLARPEQH